MSRLADIYKSEKSKKGGLLSTLGKRTLEKIDPRQIFDQSGLMAALAPRLFKSYSATGVKGGKSSVSPISPVPQSSMSDMKLDIVIKQNESLIASSQINAKNSMAIPGMSRDFNVVRQNIVKLVKLQGGTPATKADMFFKTSKEREAEYESRFAKNITSPTPVTEKKTEGKGGLLGILATIAGLAGTIVTGITGAISSALAGLGGMILGGIKAALSIDNIMKAFGIAGDALTAIFKMAAKIATSPVFLAIAGFASIAALLSYLRSNYDSSKDRYMELAAKKQREGSLSDAEEKEMKKIETPNYIRASKEELKFDPVANRTISDKESGQSTQQDILDRETRNVGLRDLATEQLVKEGNVNPGVGEIAVRAQQIGDKLRNTPNESSAESKRLLSTTPSPTPSTTPEGMQNYKSRAPTQVPSSPQTGVNGEFKSKQDFLTTMYPLAVKASEQLGGVDPNALLTQWGFESAWGTKTSGKFNYFGIKADKSWTGDKKDVMTHEFISGEKVKIPQPFRSYNSPEEAVDDYVGFLKKNKRYEKAGVFQAKTSEDFFGSLQKAGYATDPNYAAKLTKATASTASQVASLSLPNMAPAATMIAQAPSVPSRPSAMISDSTVALAEVKERNRAAPVIVNAPTTNNVQQGAGQATAQYTAPSIVDSEFMKMLVSRTT